ncbi:alpha/beta hydrolase [candidate division KSB1 bacterium]|nr:alpha/beta hydrolase [candidate division KSB1 bacterium]
MIQKFILTTFFWLAVATNTLALNIHESGAEKSEIPLLIDRAKLSAEMQPLDFSHPYLPSKSIKDYFEYYDLNIENVQHFCGTFESCGYRLVSHVFIPDSAIGTVVVMHGYYDHAGIMSNLIHFCTDLGYAVAIYDLPGHGLSSGSRFEIDDFRTYALILENFVKTIIKTCPQPLHFIGQSTGCSIAFEHLHTGHNDYFDKVIFLAPLVRSAYWGLSKFSYYLSKDFMNYFPRKHRRNSSDRDFLIFSKTDPLQQEKIFPFQFLKALISWNSRITSYEKLSRPLYIIQGKKDVIVNWRYNLKFLNKKIDPVIVVRLDGANHHLTNEHEVIRQRVFETIEKILISQ